MIDEKELLSEIAKTCPECYGLVAKAVRKMPTIEPKRGRWLRTDAYPHRRYCSECYATFIRNDEFLRLEDVPHNYCPNCGAKMEVEE